MQIFQLCKYVYDNRLNSLLSYTPFKYKVKWIVLLHVKQEFRHSGSHTVALLFYVMAVMSLNEIRPLTTESAAYQWIFALHVSVKKHVERMDEKMPPTQSSKNIRMKKSNLHDQQKSC